ncbi:class I SAM-dependent RNA methyltransferase [Galbitalea sp. SE-J8]|uniref:class I SAM-dependent RNA methyltransferase n=1 Tax=Galbitalea sp. SE-J8 TaxID=3054952 RepID=UPI00259C7889|nr:TRAM domain-containing protein [Galbitalea sp. SE-J8]MDM4762739.1 class I SAM-dependent RNA methyltransferase [Galbitalea sp. SE-J8]
MTPRQVTPRQSAESIGDTVELDVTNIAHGGIGVARLDGRVVFVTDAIPGERVLARLAETRKKSFWRADTVRVLDASPHRRPHVWAAASVDRDPADRAGGAEFGHIELAHQRELKRQVLVDALQRFAGIERGVAVEPVEGETTDGSGWRTRVRLHVDESGRLGPFAARSHRVIPVDSLPLATAELEAGAPLGESFAGEQLVDVIAPSTGGVRLVIGEQKPSTIVEVVGEREFELSDTGFWQVHRGAAAALTGAVQQAVEAERFDPDAANLDLYGGVGLLAAAVGDRFGPRTRITSVESDPRATDHAGTNLADWLGASVETARVERWIAERARDASASERARFARATIVLDPPRAGAGRDVVAAIASLAPAQVVYVACDPVALARDLGTFAKRGYELRALRAFDLFPNTHHVEAVATLAPSPG